MTDMTTQSNATNNNGDEPQAELSDGYTNEVTDKDTNNENEDTFLPIDISVDMLIQDVDSIELVDNGKVWKDSPQELNQKRVQKHRIFFEINDLLKSLEEKERLEILNKSLSSSLETSNSPEIIFNNAPTIHIKNNARRSSK